MSNRAPKTHAPMQQFAVQDDALMAAGKTIGEWADSVGQTPFYLYDRSIIAARIQALREHLPKALQLHYAIKANPMQALLDFITPLVDGLDVASAGELNKALAAGGNPKNISFAGPGKTNSELKRAMQAGILLNVESVNELQRLEGIGQVMGLRPRVSLRINPDFELKSSGMKMGGGPKPFGIDAEQAPSLLKKMPSMDIDFQGFHIFAGSQNLRAEAVIETQQKTFELAYRLAEDAPSPVRSLNIGGGLGIPYFPGEEALDLGPIGAALNEQVQQAQQRLPEAELVMELGRYLVGESGLYVSRVIDKKVSRGTTYLIADGGLHHHLAVSGNFGQVIRKNYPVAMAHRVHNEPRETVTVNGPLCTPLDILADNMELGAAEPGDLVVVYQSGAYGLSASPRGFLSHPEPGEILV